MCSMQEATDNKEDQQQHHRSPPGLARLLASSTAAVAGLLSPLLPSWALDSFAAAATDTTIDPVGLTDSPPLLDTLLVVVVTYFTVMLLYLWLSSFLSGVRGCVPKRGWGCVTDKHWS